jgi:hypothetical protein
MELAWIHLVGNLLESLQKVFRSFSTEEGVYLPLNTGEEGPTRTYGSMIS